MAGSPVPQSSIDRDLCLACGLCCNGAIFDHAPLGDGERHYITRGILAPHPSGGFAFPCTQLDGTACKTYDDRPSVCHRYRCEVLNRAERGEITAETAHRQVERARTLVAEAENLGGRITIAELRHAVRAAADVWSEAPAEQRMLLARRRLAMVALERHLDAHFRRPHQRQITELENAPMAD